MNRLNNKEITKVFALYFGSNVFCKSKIGNNTIQTEETFADIFHKISTEDWSDYYLLSLTPLSDITDDDSITVLKMSNKESEANLWNANYVRLSIDRFLTISNIYMFLISRGYLVPLFFAPYHWANDKTALQLGLAILSKAKVTELTSETRLMCRFKYTN